MATETIEFQEMPGQTLTAKVYARGGDTLLHTIATVTERTNALGHYTGDVVGPTPGWHTLNVLSGTTVIASWDVYLTNTARTAQARDVNPDVAADVAAILVDTGTTLDGRIPAALVGGRMDSSVGAMAANVITAAATAADFGTEIAAAVWDAATSGMSTVGSIGKKFADWVVGTIDTYTGNTKQTGDNYARLGAPAGASVSADVAAVKVDTAAILVDTGTTLDGRIPAALGADGFMKASIFGMMGTALTETAGQIAAAFKQFFDIASPTGNMKAITAVTTVTTTTNLTNLPAAAALEATLTDMKGATFDTSTDSLEAIRNRGDAAWTTGSAGTIPVLRGIVTRSGSTYFVSYHLVVNGAIIAGASLSVLAVTFYDEDGTNLTFSGTPTAHATGIVYASGTLTTPVTDNRPVKVKVTATYNAVAYSDFLDAVSRA